MAKNVHCAQSRSRIQVLMESGLGYLRRRNERQRPSKTSRLQSCETMTKEQLKKKVISVNGSLILILQNPNPCKCIRKPKK